MGTSGHRWTKEEDDFLIENYPLLGSKNTVEALKSKLGTDVSTSSLQYRISYLRNIKNIDISRIVENKESWTLEEDQFLVEHYSNYSNKEIQRMILELFGKNRTIEAIMRRANEKPGLKKMVFKKPSRVWTEEVNEYLFKNASSKTCEEMTAELNTIFNKEFSVNSVRNQIKKLRKQKGSTIIPYKRSLTRNNGDIAVWTGDDKIPHLYIKVGNGKGSKGWMEYKHFLMGEEANGKCVITLNNDNCDIRPENLAVVSSAVNTKLTRYKMRSDDPEITKAGIKLCELEEALENSEKE